ncbi:MAG: hypothetical protein M1831_003818 [Alyxoria varia]|nr:MAG: hypothetical protein M1831_003818 [Alyxoria varia]
MSNPGEYPLQTASLLDGEKASSPPSPSWRDPLVYIAKFKRLLHYILSTVLTRPFHAALWRRFGYALMPQPLRSFILKEQTPPRKTFSTSYLNGVRGCTALKVFTFHYMHAFSDITFVPYGSDERHTYFLELPIIRYLYAGYTAHIFFGIAGYLTSVRLLQMMDDPDPTSQSKALSTVTGSLFRRAFRLYLPVAFISLISTVWLTLGLYEHNRPYLLDHEKYFPGEWNEPRPIRYDTYYEQLRFWSSEMFGVTNIIWEKTFYPIHDQHFWSILSEMRASLHLYLCLLAVAQCTRRVRLVFFLCLTFIYFCWNHWEIWVYILGAFVAQVDVILTEKAKKNSAPLSPSQEKLEPMDIDGPSGVQNILRKASGGVQRFSSRASFTSLRFFGFLTAFYLLSYPTYGFHLHAPGYMTLNKAIPHWMNRKDKFYPNIGTALLLFLLVRSDPQTSKWRKFLNSRIPQYMGSLSFGFYIVHGSIMHLFGYMIPQWIWWHWLGLEGPNNTTDFQWIVGLIAGWIPTFIVSLWAADVWTREVEGRCVKWVKALEKYCFRRR